MKNKGKNCISAPKNTCSLGSLASALWQQTCIIPSGKPCQTFFWRAVSLKNTLHRRCPYLIFLVLLRKFSLAEKIIRVPQCWSHEVNVKLIRKLHEYFKYFLLKKPYIFIYTIEKYQDSIELLIVRVFGNQQHAGSYLGLQDKNRCVEVSVETSPKVINNGLWS